MIKEIEYYKMINSKYPNSLSELKIFNKNVIIEDQSYFYKDDNANNKKEIYYNLLNSNNYELFAVGKDGKPNTNDDILPEINKDEIKSIGLKTYKIIEKE